MLKLDEVSMLQVSDALHVIESIRDVREIVILVFYQVTLVSVIFVNTFLLLMAEVYMLVRYHRSASG
mgnify:CR=1 FL=1|jgi:hypothetical protein